MIIFCYHQCLTDAVTAYHILGSLITKLCLTVCDPMNCRPSGSSVHGIPHTRILKWVAVPSPGDLLDPGIKPVSPALQVDSLPTDLQVKPPILLNSSEKKPCQTLMLEIHLLAYTILYYFWSSSHFPASVFFTKSFRLLPLLTSYQSKQEPRHSK